MDWVQHYAIDQLKQAKGHPTSERQAICRYLKQGTGAGFSTGELVDWLGISSPSLLDQAGYNDAEATRIMATLADISDQEIEQIRIGTPSHLP